MPAFRGGARQRDQSVVRHDDPVARQNPGYDSFLIGRSAAEAKPEAKRGGASRPAPRHAAVRHSVNAEMNF